MVFRYKLIKWRGLELTMGKRGEIITCFGFLTLKELPEQWNNTKKIQVTVKQQVAPLQASEVAIIRRKCGQFDVSVQAFCKYCYT